MYEDALGAERASVTNGNEPASDGVLAAETLGFIGTHPNSNVETVASHLGIPWRACLSLMENLALLGELRISNGATQPTACLAG